MSASGFVSQTVLNTIASASPEQKARIVAEARKVLPDAPQDAALAVAALSGFAAGRRQSFLSALFVRECMEGGPVRPSIAGRPVR